MEAFDVMEFGRMAVIQDPSGAVVGAWQPKAHIGASLANVPGSLSWNELATRDTQAAEKFYTGVFGWNAQTQDMGGSNYTMFSVGDRLNGGMMAMNEQWGDAPPHWMVYFAVADCDASAATAKAQGGRLMVEPMDIPEIGRMAVVQDPQGAVFTIIKLNNPE